MALPGGLKQNSRPKRPLLFNSLVFLFKNRKIAYFFKLILAQLNNSGVHE